MQDFKEVHIAIRILVPDTMDESKLVEQLIHHLTPMQLQMEINRALFENRLIGEETMQ